MNILGNFSLFTRDRFSNIEGYEDIKNIIERALEAEENYNVLLVGPPASSKILGIWKIT